MSFLVGVQLARGLGVEGYGVYGLTMSIVALLSVIPEFGLPQLVTREVASAHAHGDWTRLRSVLHWSTRIALILSVCVTLAVASWVFVVGLYDPRLARPLLFGLVMIPPAVLGRLCAAALRGLQRIVEGQLPDLLRPAMYSGLLMMVPLLFGISLDPSLVMGLQALAAILTFLIVAPLLRRSIPEPVRTAIPGPPVSGWLASAFPMALTEGARILQGHMVVLLLGAMTTASVVGSYRVASSIYFLIMTPVSLLNVVVMSLISKLHAEGDRLRLQRMLTWVAVLMVAGVIILSLPFFLLGRPMLVWVFGIDFAAAHVSLLVLCGGATISAAFGANAALLNMTSHETRVTRSFAMAVVALAVLSPALIHVGGANGAATATVCSLLMWNMSMWHDGRRLLRLDTSVLSLIRRTLPNAT